MASRGLLRGMKFHKRLISNIGEGTILLSVLFLALYDNSVIVMCIFNDLLTILQVGFST